MPLSGDRLGDALLAAVNAVADKTNRQAIFRALGNAIVTEVQANGLVTVTVATTGSASAQTGTGTGTVT